MPDIHSAKFAFARTRILVVNEEASSLNALCQTLNEQGYVTSGFTDAMPALAALRGGKFDVLLTVLTSPEIECTGLLQAALKIDSHLAGVVMTGEGTMSSAIEAMRVGSMDRVPTPISVSEMPTVLTQAIAVSQIREADVNFEQIHRALALEPETANKEHAVFGITLSQDLLQPLRSIAGFAELLSQQSRADLPPESQHYLDFIIKKTGHMQQLIADLTHFYELGSQPFAGRPLSASTLVERALEGFLYDPAYANTDVIVGDLPACVGDAELLQELYTNLLANAFKFSGKKAYPKVEIGCEKAASGNVYFVRDNGAGFDETRAGKLFTLFYRLHSANEFPGTGVGLATAENIIARHGGKIWATSIVGEGSTFYFTLGDARPE